MADILKKHLKMKINGVAQTIFPYTHLESVVDEDGKTLKEMLDEINTEIDEMASNTSVEVPDGVTYVDFSGVTTPSIDIKIDADTLNGYTADDFVKNEDLSSITADRATYDAQGNVIHETYSTKTELEQSIQDAIDNLPVGGEGGISGGDATTLDGHDSDYFATAQSVTESLEAAKAYNDAAYANANAYTDTKISELINGAPTTLDTLKEIADAMIENADIVEALDVAVGSKVPQAEYDGHAGNDTIHITADERERWNNAANSGTSSDASTLNGKSESELSVANSEQLGGKAASEYALVDGKFNSVGKNGYIVYPDGGMYTATTNYTGRIRITLPQSWTGTFLKFKVSIYSFFDNGIVEYFIGGYNYTAENAWYRPSAYSVGIKDSSPSNLPVRFAHDGAKCVVTIGNDDTYWEYPTIRISDITLGYVNLADYESWRKNWNISITADNSDLTVSGTIENPFIGANYLPIDGSKPITGSLFRWAYGNGAVSGSVLHSALVSFIDANNTNGDGSAIVLYNENATDVPNKLFYRITQNGVNRDYALLHSGNSAKCVVSDTDLEVGSTTTYADGTLIFVKEMA